MRFRRQFRIIKRNRIIIIRKATIKDTDAIAQNNILLAEETEQLVISLNKSIKGRKKAIEHPDKGFYLVADHDESIIGQLFITSDWRNQAIWWIHRVYVRKPWRKQGVFKALLLQLQKIADYQNVFAIRLYMVKQNETALDIYKKLGFEDTPFLILGKTFD